MHWVAEHSFDGVSAEEREENGRFDLLQGFVLFLGREEMKACQVFQAFAVDFARRFFALVAEFVRSFFEGRLRVAITIAAVGAGELAVDVDRDAGFARARAGIVRREDARHRSGDDEGFGFGKKTKWNSHRLLLRGEQRRLAIERVDNDSAEGGGGKSQKMAPAHGQESTRAKALVKQDYSSSETVPTFLLSKNPLLAIMGIAWRINVNHDFGIPLGVGRRKMKIHLLYFVASVTLCTACVPAALAQENCSHPRIISVTGTAEIKVAPDEVTLTLGVDSHDRELAVAKANNDLRVKKVMELARAAGIEAKNIQTSALTMGPEYSEEKIPKLLGYQVSQTITVILKDLFKYEDLMTASLKAGVNRVDGVSFSVADPSKYKAEARLKAIRAAREKANTMASELGQTIGKPWEVAEQNDFETTISTANLAVQYQMPRRLEGETIAGGELTIRASVRVSFQLE